MSPDSPILAVLLCTFNGGRHLDGQLSSIATQNLPVSRIHCSDDGSTDNTLGVLRDFSRTKTGIDISISEGPSRGAAANFLSSLCELTADTDYLAFADQDDIWHPQKLSRAVQVLSAHEAKKPLLYCSRTQAISESGQPLGLSPLFSRPPSFANALVHNIGGGNTMVLNRAAWKLLQSAGKVDVPSHDWWTYLLVSGAGGTVIYDPKPLINYRQHDENIVGANLGNLSRLRRLGGLVRGVNRARYERNLLALQANAELLTPANRLLLEQFARVHGGSFPARLKALFASGVYAQTRLGNLGLLWATLLKKI